MSDERELISSNEAIEMESADAGVLICPNCSKELDNIYHINNIIVDNYECPDCGNVAIFDEYHVEGDY